MVKTIEYTRAALACKVPPDWMELPDKVSNREPLI